MAALSVRALESRNFRLYLAGQFVSLIGTWIQGVASSWLMYRLTNSPFWLGLLGFGGQIPLFVLPPLSGALADRTSRHRILVITQSLALVQALVLAVLVLSGKITTGYLLALNVCLGVIMAFDTPARQSFVIDMVEKKELLGNAIALNSVIFNSTRLIGPPLAGLLIAAVGEGQCFLINSVSFFAVIAALLAMKNIPAPRGQSHGRVLSHIGEGLSYSFGSKPIRSILLLLAVINMMGMPFIILMPVFATKILGGGPHTLGFLMGAGGLGALAGSIFLTSRRGVSGFEKMILAASFGMSAALGLFSQSRVLWLSLVLIFCVGCCLVMVMASSNTVLQTLVDDDKRGRVMSLFAISIMGMAPLGNLIAGSVAEHVGTPRTLFWCAMMCGAAAVYFASRSGIIREAIAGRQGAGGTEPRPR